MNSSSFDGRPLSSATRRNQYDAAGALSHDDDGIGTRPYDLQGTKVCRYNWHGAGSLGWPFPML